MRLTCSSARRTAGTLEAMTLFVIGAGPGVGTAVARRFGREGHSVGLVARNRDRLEAATRHGVASAFATADVRDPVAVRSAIRRAA